MRSARPIAFPGLLMASLMFAQMTWGQDLSEYSFCVDPGHGGDQPGAIGPTGLTEKEINLTTCFFFRDSLEAAGATVYMTRVTDVTLPLAARSGLANSMAVDRCISVHHNASTNSSANYTGVHVYLDAPFIDLHMASEIVARLDSVLNIGVVSTNCGTWGVHADNFHMVREPNMPCCLTENSFISNPAEEARLRDATYLNSNATAMFIGLAKHITNSPEPPPPTLQIPEMISVLNNSTGTQAAIRWWRHPVETVLGFRLYQSMDGINWGSPILDEVTLTPQDTTVTIEDLQPDQIYYFKMLAVDTTYEAPESDFSNTYCLLTSGSPVHVLIVDGFDRRSSWQSPGHPFAGYNARSLDKLDITFETCSNEAPGREVSLGDYDALVWILGDEGTETKTFGIREQNIVKSYLEDGGRLFVTGSEIGWDLDAQGTSADRAFYNNYLKASFVGDDSGDDTVTGVPGTIFEGLSFSYGQTYEEDYPDYIEAFGGGIVNLEYNTSQKAGVQYRGPFGSGDQEGAVVYMAFPWETIGSEGARDQTMSRVMDFFGFSTDVLDELAESPSVPGEFRLFQNYPNPFNSTTTLSYRIPAAEMVIAKIFNIQGQEVRTLLQGQQRAGCHILKWDGLNDQGSPAASGIYLCQLRAGPQMATRKMVLIR